MLNFDNAPINYLYNLWYNTHPFVNKFIYNNESSLGLERQPLLANSPPPKLLASTKLLAKTSNTESTQLVRASRLKIKEDMIF